MIEIVIHLDETDETIVSVGDTDAEAVISAHGYDAETVDYTTNNF